MLHEHDIAHCCANAFRSLFRFGFITTLRCRCHHIASHTFAFISHLAGGYFHEFQIAHGVRWMCNWKKCTQRFFFEIQVRCWPYRFVSHHKHTMRCVHQLQCIEFMNLRKSPNSLSIHNFHSYRKCVRSFAMCDTQAIKEIIINRICLCERIVARYYIRSFMHAEMSSIHFVWMSTKGDEAMVCVVMP